MQHNLTGEISSNSVNNKKLKMEAECRNPSCNNKLIYQLIFFGPDCGLSCISCKRAEGNMAHTFFLVPFCHFLCSVTMYLPGTRGQEAAREGKEWVEC